MRARTQSTHAHAITLRPLPLPKQFIESCLKCQEALYLADPKSVEYLYTREEFDELARTIDQAKTGRIN